MVKGGVGQEATQLASAAALCRECQRCSRVPLKETPLFNSVFSSTHAISHRSRPHQSEIGTVKQPRGGLREREMPLDGVTEGQSHTPQTQSTPFVASHRLDLEIWKRACPWPCREDPRLPSPSIVTEASDQRPETRNHGELSQERAIQQGAGQGSGNVMRR